MWKLLSKTHSKLIFSEDYLIMLMVHHHHILPPPSGTNGLRARDKDIYVLYLFQR